RSQCVCAADVPHFLLPAQDKNQNVVQISLDFQPFQNRETARGGQSEIQEQDPGQRKAPPVGILSASFKIRDRLLGAGDGKQSVGDSDALKHALQQRGVLDRVFHEQNRFFGNI